MLEVNDRTNCISVEKKTEKKRGQATFLSAGGRDGVTWIRVPGPSRAAGATQVCAKGLLAVHTGTECGEFLLEEWLINPVRSVLRQRNWGCVREVGNAETRPRPVGRLFDQPGMDRIAEHVAQDPEEVAILLKGKASDPSLPTCL